jgi:hypothetical protein
MERRADFQQTPKCSLSIVAGFATEVGLMSLI